MKAVLYKSFTLIELLIVVAIIGILASLLLPSLSRARAEAQSAVCKSNLKQIGIGVFLYTDDSNDFMPTNNIASSAAFSPGLVFYTAPYLDITLDSTDVRQTDLRGSVFDEPVLEGNVYGGITFPVASGYGWNWRYMGYKQNNTGNFGPKKMGGITDPSTKMLAADTSDTTDLEGNVYFRYQNVGNRHRKESINALHGDGSASLVYKIAIISNSNSKWWYEDNSY